MRGRGEATKMASQLDRDYLRLHIARAEGRMLLMPLSAY